MRLRCRFSRFGFEDYACRHGQRRDSRRKYTLLIIFACACSSNSAAQCLSAGKERSPVMTLPSWLQVRECCLASALDLLRRRMRGMRRILQRSTSIPRLDFTPVCHCHALLGDSHNSCRCQCHDRSCIGLSDEHERDSKVSSSTAEGQACICGGHSLLQ